MPPVGACCRTDVLNTGMFPIEEGLCATVGDFRLESIESSLTSLTKRTTAIPASRFLEETIDLQGQSSRTLLKSLTALFARVVSDGAGRKARDERGTPPRAQRPRGTRWHVICTMLPGRVVGLSLTERRESATTTRAERKVMAMQGRQRAAAGLLGLIMAASSLACKSTQKADASTIGPTPREACFNTYRVRSFSPLHERFVYVRAYGDEHYLLTMDAIYLGLPRATGIRISGTFSRVCSETGAMITFEDFGRPVTCRIVSVEAVASKDEAQRLVEERSAAGPKE